MDRPRTRNCTITIADAAVTCPLTYPLSLPRSWLVRIVIPEGTRSSAVVPCWWRSPTTSVVREEKGTRVSRIRLTNYPRTEDEFHAASFNRLSFCGKKLDSIRESNERASRFRRGGGGWPADRNLASVESQKPSSN